MSRITVTMKDGKHRTYDDHVSRAPPSIRYEIGFVVVTDTYGAEISIPAAEVSEVHKEAEPKRW